MENYFQKFGSHDKEGEGGISSLFLKNRPSPPPKNPLTTFNSLV
nr:MAG TPA: hypothetical protein [Caudoviricetes sp.]